MPEKSLRQAAPGGDVFAAVFALVALLVAIGIVRNPTSLVSVIFGLIFIALFAVPAYVLFASSRSTGIFVTEDQVEYRLLGRPRKSWKRAEVGAIEPMGGGLKVLGPDGRLIGQFRFRWWSTEKVARFARDAGLSPQVQPGKTGDG